MLSKKHLRINTVSFPSPNNKAILTVDGSVQIPHFVERTDSFDRAGSCALHAIEQKVVTTALIVNIWIFSEEASGNHAHSYTESAMRVDLVVYADILQINIDEIHGYRQ